MKFFFIVVAPAVTVSAAARELLHLKSGVARGFLSGLTNRLLQKCRDASKRVFSRAARFCIVYGWRPSSKLSNTQIVFVSGTLCNHSEHTRFLEDILIHKTVCCGKPLFCFGRCDCSGVCVRAFRLATRVRIVCESALQFALSVDWFVAGFGAPVWEVDAVVVVLALVLGDWAQCRYVYSVAV